MGLLRRGGFSALRKLKLAGILLCAALILAACGNPDLPLPEAEADPGNVLRVDVAASFGSLNPLQDVHSGSAIVYPFLHGYLCVPDAGGELEPDLAEEWLYDPSRLIWTIRLRKNVRFHDGRPVTAEDVKYSFDEAGRQPHHMVRTALASVASITVPAPCIVQFNLHRDDPELLSKAWGQEIVPAPGEEPAGESCVPIGSGPFAFDYSQGEGEVGLRAYEDYYRGRPSLDRVVFYHVPDRESSWARLILGKTDMVREIYPKDYEMIRSHTDLFQFFLGTSPYYIVLLYNTRHPLLSDPGIRLALSHAIDTSHIIKEILMGMGVAALGPGGVEAPSGNPGVGPVPYDPKRALELLRQAGWAYDERGRYLTRNGRDFEIEILYFRRYQIDERVAEYLQLCFNDIGIKARIRSVPLDILISKYGTNDDFQAVLTEMRGAGGKPEILRSLWGNGDGHTAFAGRFNHPDVDRLLEQASREADPQKRRELSLQAEALIASLQPGSFLFHRVFADVVSIRIALPPSFAFCTAWTHRLWQASVRPLRTDSAR